VLDLLPLCSLVPTDQPTPQPSLALSLLPSPVPTSHHLPHSNGPPANTLQPIPASLVECRSLEQHLLPGRAVGGEGVIVGEEPKGEGTLRGGGDEWRKRTA